MKTCTGTPATTRQGTVVCGVLFASLRTIQSVNNLCKTLIEVHWMHRGYFFFSSSILSCLWFAFFLLQEWIWRKPSDVSARSSASLPAPLCFFSFVLLALLFSFSEFPLFLWCVLQCVLAALEASITSLSHRPQLPCVSAVSLGYFDAIFSGFV